MTDPMSSQIQPGQDAPAEDDTEGHMPFRRTVTEQEPTDDQDEDTEAHGFRGN